VGEVIGVGTESRRHLEVVHILIDHLWLPALILVVVLLELLGNSFTLQFANVGSSAPDLVADDVHKTQVVFSFALLAPLLAGAIC